MFIVVDFFTIVDFFIVVDIFFIADFFIVIDVFTIANFFIVVNSSPSLVGGLCPLPTLPTYPNGRQGLFLARCQREPERLPLIRRMQRSRYDRRSNYSGAA